MLGSIHSRRMLCGGHVRHPGSQPASRMGVTEWRHRCDRASRTAKRRAGAPGVAPRCLPDRSCGSARSRRSRWRDCACRRASAQGVEGHSARARRRSRQENPHSRPSPRILTPRAENVEPAPWGVRRRESATSSHARAGGRVVDSRHLPVGLGLGCGADSDGSPSISSADDPSCSLWSPWTPDRISRSASPPMRRVMHGV